MLMITVEAEAPVVTFRLNGRLTGAGIRELSRSWSAAARQRPHRKVLFDLNGVTSVDASGKDFLAKAYRRGSRLIAGAATRAIVEEVTIGRETEHLCSILEVEGKLQSPVSPELSQRVEAALARGQRSVLLNLLRLTDIDAAGIGELVRLFNVTKALGGALRTANARRHVKQLLEITGLLPLLSPAP